MASAATARLWPSKQTSTSGGENIIIYLRLLIVLTALTPSTASKIIKICWFAAE